MSKKIKMSNMMLTDPKQGFLAYLSELNSIKTPGKITLAVVNTIKGCVQPNEDYWTSRKAIFESKCKKDESGKPALVEVMNQGIAMQEYDFETDQERINCMNEIVDLQNKEIEIIVYPFSSKDIEGIEEISGNVILGLGAMVEFNE